MLVNQVHQAVGEAGRESTGRNRSSRPCCSRRVTYTRGNFSKAVNRMYGIGLIVAQQDIEFRLVLLDEIIFERQRFPSIVDHDVIKIGDFAHQRAGLGVLPARFEKIGAHALAQRIAPCRRRESCPGHPQTGTHPVGREVDRLFRGVPFSARYNNARLILGACERTRATPMITNRI